MPDRQRGRAPPDPSDGCPAPPDRDKDGIFDADDKCPDDPEDKDGIQDDDGCPEVDIDNDGIPDTEDACPHEPGPRSEVPEKNGCPGLTKFEEDGSITLLEPIQFEYNRATIKTVSFPILDEVVILMKARPEISIGVYGHSDNKGGKAYNLKLSQARAAACLDYLVKQGIEQKRLQSEGYGPDKPSRRQRHRRRPREESPRRVQGHRRPRWRRVRGCQRRRGRRADTEGAAEPDRAPRKATKGARGPAWGPSSPLLFVGPTRRPYSSTLASLSNIPNLGSYTDLPRPGSTMMSV